MVVTNIYSETNASDGRCSNYAMLSAAFAKNEGFTLVEILVATVIVSILLTMATLNFSDWIIKSRVESMVKEITTDISEVRMQAMTRKQRHSITINANSYVVRSYESDEEDLFAGGTVVPNGTHTTRYGLKSNSATFFNGTVLEFNERGLLVSTTASIYIDANSSASVDCISIHTARTNPGKRNAAWSSCDDR